MHHQLSIKEALGLGFMFAFRNIGTIFLLFLFPFILHAVQGFFNNFLQNVVARFSVDLLFNWMSAVFGAVIILPIFLGLYRTGKPAYTLTISKTLLLRVIGVTIINEIILLNLNLFSLFRESLTTEHLFILLAIEILMILVFIFLLYPYTYFSTIFVVDQNLSVKEALAASSRIVNGQALYIFFSTIIVVLILGLSILTIIGPFFMAAAIEIVYIHFYHVLQGRMHEMVRLH